MSGIKEYKCPQCGGQMEFNIKNQNMTCPFCSKEMTIEEYESTESEKSSEAVSIKGEDNALWQAKEEANTWQSGETEGIRIYVCESCGGEIIADDTTGASTCPYCDNRVVVKGQFEGDLRPDYIIPFKFDKKDAKKAYLDHLKGKIFLPKVFKKENHIDEIKGIYVPFWLFDIDVDADLIFNAERQTVHVSGDTEYTDHDYYEATRSGKISFERIPEDGSEKMDDTLMESVEPFNFADATEFNSAYLSGYMADRYDVGVEDRTARAKDRAVQSTLDSFRETVTGYHAVRDGGGRVDITGAEYSYALYPVWILNTTWHGEKYVFAMNGQSGKMAGNLPFDKTLFAKYIALRGPVLGLAIYAAMYIFNML